MNRGVVLFAHGSRDVRWAEPFAAVEARVRALLPDVPVVAAFLERMEPDLADAVAQLVRAGVRRVRVVPLFLGYGGHLREDLPRLAAAVAAEHEGVTVDLAPPAGEDPQILAALADYCVRAMREDTA